MAKKESQMQIEMYENGNKDTESSMECGQWILKVCEKPFHTYQCSCMLNERIERCKEAKIYEKVKVGNCNCNCDSYGAIMMERC